MKLIVCVSCKDMVMLTASGIRTCACGMTAGRYLEDNITAVVTKGAVLVGIDNNSYKQALVNALSEQCQKWDQRVDFYFTGWVPNHPGEVVYKKTLKAVEKYKLPKKKYTNKSTTPTDSA